MVVYVDVDGSMTSKPDGPWGPPRLDVIETVKSAIAAGHYVTIWSAQGESYCRSFARKYHICPHAFASKPDLCVDDRPDLRPPGKMPIIPPEAFKAYMVKHNGI